MNEHLAPGRLLVATPKIEDPNFSRTIVLLLDYDHGGALGVILNRPGNVDVRTVLEPWTNAAAAPAVLFDGGPLQPGAVIGVGRRTGVHDASEGWTPVFEHVGIVDLHLSPVDFGDLDGMRMFSGYSSWGPGQLELELAEGSWFVCDADPYDGLHPDPDVLWRSVLRRQRGETAWFATFPSDPALN